MFLNNKKTLDFRFVVSSDMSGVRLDQYLVYNIKTASRSLINVAIRSGNVLVGGVARKSSYKLKRNEEIVGSIVEKSEIDMCAQKIDFEIIYEDDYLMFISKPPGLVVHPGSGNLQNTLANGLIYHCREIAKVGDYIRPGIVHRLDKDTSGVMVVAKQQHVHAQLSEMFKNRDVEKVYLALVCGVLERKQGRIVAPIGRHPINRKKMAVRESSGRYAVTNYNVIEEFNSRISLVQLKIETGRTHQIRVHMPHIGAPIAGDKLYGSRHSCGDFSRQMLHSHLLSLKHPVNGEQLRFEAPLSPDFAENLAVLRGKV